MNEIEVSCPCGAPVPHCHCVAYSGAHRHPDQLQGREQVNLPLCAYFEPAPVSAEAGLLEGVVFSEPHDAGEGPLFFFVPVADGAAVRVPVCQRHCDVLSRQFGGEK